MYFRYSGLGHDRSISIHTQRFRRAEEEKRRTGVFREDPSVAGSEIKRSGVATPNEHCCTALAMDEKHPLGCLGDH